MGFPLVPKFTILNDLEKGPMAVILCYVTNFRSSGAVTSKWLKLYPCFCEKV